MISIEQQLNGVLHFFFHFLFTIINVSCRAYINVIMCIIKKSQNN